MTYIKECIWGGMLLLWLFISANTKEEGWITAIVLGIGYIIATLFCIYLDRRKGGIHKNLPTDTQNAVVLVVLALDNVLGGYTPEYMFIVSVVTLWLLFDSHSRSEKTSRLDE
ncbi:MAG: hypothetical protein NC388_05240 [Clostridium sp.]|nr:hypothetical protein [Clostridium sp.]